MAYDEGLAQRVREALQDHHAVVESVVEKKMFGGIGFMVRGNLCCGVLRDDLIVRVGPAGYAAALAQPHARLFDITGRPMTGWVMVAPEGYASDEALEEWVRQGVEFAHSLPAK
ncbi:MAG: TfoX/Sxy family protein [Chloroflexi bacterium]|nr:TfoX/Sxy family protein [Chloroflexota bacterium]